MFIYMNPMTCFGSYRSEFSLKVMASSCISKTFLILYFSLIVPVHLFAAKSHKLLYCAIEEHQWVIWNMLIAVDIIYNKYHEIQKRPKRIIDEMFMMSMFNTLDNSFIKFKKDNKHLYKKKKLSFVPGPVLNLFLTNCWGKNCFIQATKTTRRRQNL